jgi:acetyltransferase-like isoleucine patch superfamily enzyme
VSVAPNCAIHDGCDIAARTSIRSGAVLGGAGFQTCRDGDGLLELAHGGGLEIGEDAIIFENAVIARGVFRQSTRIGPQTRVGAGAFVSHNVQAGARTHIGHGAVVNGNVRIGDGVWIGPGAVISNKLSIGSGARISLGSVVAADVAAGEHVSGNLARPHREFLRGLSGKRWSASTIMGRSRAAPRRCSSNQRTCSCTSVTRSMYLPASEGATCWKEYCPHFTLAGACCSRSFVCRAVDAGRAAILDGGTIRSISGVWRQHNPVLRPTPRHTVAPAAGPNRDDVVLVGLQPPHEPFPLLGSDDLVLVGIGQAEHCHQRDEIARSLTRDFCAQLNALFGRQLLRSEPSVLVRIVPAEQRRPGRDVHRIARRTGEERAREQQPVTGHRNRNRHAAGRTTRFVGRGRPGHSARIAEGVPASQPHANRPKPIGPVGADRGNCAV